MNALPLASLRSVSKTYGRPGAPVYALRDVSADIDENEIVVLAGPSGSGKTTLLNLVAALDRPDAGDITVAGTAVSRLTLAAAAKYRRERIGIVFQSYNLLPQLSALENVLLPMIARHAPDRRRALELLEAVGLAARSGHRPSQLSGGEQQRVAIARALANDPMLVLADEPTGNLDDENARNILRLLWRACREQHKTLLLATHDRQAIAAADIVLELSAGTLTRASRRPAAVPEPVQARFG
jgi:ABC-type lipoprotein export system ATPase subunit